MMPRLGIGDLPQPSEAYLITRVPAPAPDAMGYEREAFETEDFAYRQDRVRARLCSGVRSRLVRRAHADRLAWLLGGARTPRTLASSRRWRRFRVRIIGALWKLVVEGRWNPARRGEVSILSVTPRSWELTPTELASVRGEHLLARFKTWLNRGGAALADGWLVACLHGEFESGRGVYRVHLHGVAAGGMIAIVDGLRELDDCNSSLDPPDGRKRAPSRVVISREPLTDLPHALSYQFKGWWPSRWIGMVKRTGKVERARWAARIRNPEHTELLLWFDQHQFADITLLMKVRVGRQGLELTTRRDEESAS